jgi:translation elongation factor EF-Tu-like GTPase
MKSRFALPADFEAVVRIFTHEQGGRKSPSFNGLRWDFSYAEDDPAKGLWMIHPDFVDEGGDSLAQDRPLPLDIKLPARFLILDDKLRAEVHRPRLRVATRFFCHEGSKRVAEGRVTKILALNEERPAR